ncbi:MAG TPA: hypothetical protein VIG99_00755 [Myxococcaceae bacterium]|jgi:hypothetical protein
MEHFYAAGFVCADSLTWEADASGVKLAGEIGCKGNIVIHVFKLIALIEPSAHPEDVNVLVQTFRYAYNASVRGHGNFLRHDNAHSYPGHPDQHHRHEFDWRTGEELPGLPHWVGTEGWPTLGDFIQEISDWYWQHRDELPEPEAVPVLDLR